jgi:hypothetical protein
MAFNQPNSADALVKRIHIELLAAVPSSLLNKYGWNEFWTYDRPDTTDPIELARQTLHCLRTDDEGNWHGNTDIISAIFSFTHAQCAKSPTKEQFKQLLRLLKLGDKNGIDAWFKEVFPPPEDDYPAF